METIFNQIKEIYLKQTETNPVKIARNIMREPYVNIHGPEHHFIDGAAFLTAMYNAGAGFNLEKALDEHEKRSKKMPGATCGQWGVCGSVSSVGSALSIIYGTGPLSDNEHYKNNLRFTSVALSKMADIGGPRCCKRNAFISLNTAVEFVREKYNVQLESENTKCSFSYMNEQCIEKRCPFYQSGSDLL